MASKRRLRRRQCGSKVRYPTREMAKDAMCSVIRNGRKHGGWLHVYPCRFCGGFHYGHRPKIHNER